MAAVAWFILGHVPAVSQTIMAPETVVASNSPRPERAGGGAAHVYLLRGLMNVFSLGMDDLAMKLNRRGIAATVYNHTGWESIADEIAAKYKAGRHGPIILIGHSFGADAVMHMGSYLSAKGVPVALIVPLDASGPLPAAPRVAHVLNLTQRDYARMTRGAGFTGELQNIDLSKDENIGHLNIDKSARLHAMVIAKIQGIIGRGGGQAPPPTAAPARRGNNHDSAKVTPIKPAEATITSSVAAAPATAPALAVPAPASDPAPAPEPLKLKSLLPD
jgi:pimeloyl-ACP methyl ester carboxylesterase